MYNSKEIATYTKRELAEYVLSGQVPLQMLENDGLSLRQYQLLEQEIENMQHDENDWGAAVAEGTKKGYKRYLNKYDKPSNGSWEDTSYHGRHVGEAKDLLGILRSQKAESDDTERTHPHKPTGDKEDREQANDNGAHRPVEFTKLGPWFKWSLIVIGIFVVILTGLMAISSHNKEIKYTEDTWRNSINTYADKMTSKATQLYNNKKFTEAVDMYSKSVEFRREYDFVPDVEVPWLTACDTLINAQACGRAVTDSLAKSLDHYKAHSQFSCGYAYVPRADGYDYIDHRGKPLKFAKKPDEAGEPFKCNLLKVKETGGYIDLNGNVQTLGNIFSDWASFSDGLAAVQDRATGKWGYINTFLNMVIDPEFDYATDFIDGFALVRNGDKWYYINHNATKRYEVSKLDKKDVGYAHSISTYYYIDGLALGGTNDVGKVLLITKDGRSKVYNTNDKYNTQYRFHSDLRLFRDSTNNGKYGYEDKNGHIQIPSAYTHANDFRDRRAIVGNGSAFGVINIHGDTIIPIKYKELQWLSDDMLKFSTMVDIVEDINNDKDKSDKNPRRKDAKRHTHEERGQNQSRHRTETYYGVINLKGDTIHPAIYSAINPYSDGFAVANKGNNIWGYIDKYGLSTYDYDPLPTDSVQQMSTETSYDNGPAPRPKHSSGWIISWIVLSLFICASLATLYFTTNWLYPTAARFTVTRLKPWFIGITRKLEAKNSDGQIPDEIKPDICKGKDTRK